MSKRDMLKLNAIHKMPEWRVPRDLATFIANDEIWTADEDWDPLTISASGPIEYRGRAISMEWTVEFEPFGELFHAANTYQFGRADGPAGPDGWDWTELVVDEFVKSHPGMAPQVHTDEEQATCVVWVESEEACRLLVETIWRLIFGPFPKKPNKR